MSGTAAVDTTVRDNFHVLTGASGSGKSSIIAALRARGVLCVDEIGRAVVRDEMRDDGTGTPWQDHVRFMELLFTRSLVAYDAISERTLPVFFDRSLVECLSYVRGLAPMLRKKRLAMMTARRYHRTVFVTRPWREIYTLDAERRHSFEQGVVYHHQEIAAYVDTGYTLVDVPRADVATRVDFILAHVARGNGAA